MSNAPFQLGPEESDGPDPGAATASANSWTRRRFLLLTGAAGSAFAATGIAFPATTTSAAAGPSGNAGAAPGAPAVGSDALTVTLQVNGKAHTLALDPRTTLLDALRDRLALTGCKKGCDHGQCGACTVLLDGRRANACLLLAASCEGDPITTIEGLAQGDALHPMQAAFLAHDGFQCGYCTPGQICSAVACVREGRAGNEDEVREFMSGNLCRCGAYPNIRAAILAARDATLALPAV